MTWELQPIFGPWTYRPQRFRELRICDRCERRCAVWLAAADGSILCRYCSGFAYRLQKTPIERIRWKAERLRRRNGVGPFPEPWPAPPRWSRGRWYRDRDLCQRMEDSLFDLADSGLTELQQMAAEAEAILKADKLNP